MKYLLVAIGFSFACYSSYAAPPADADPSLGPFFHGLRQPGANGMGCCDLSDCRNVRYRPVQDGWEVYIAKGEDMHGFPNGTNTWERVPPRALLPPRENPTGEAVACWSPVMGVLCFLKGNET